MAKKKFTWQNSFWVHLPKCTLSNYLNFLFVIFVVFPKKKGVCSETFPRPPPQPQPESRL